MKKGLVAIALIGVVALTITACGTAKSAATAAGPAETVTVVETQPAAAETQPAETPTVEESNETSGQQNARETAESYLESGSFSRKGLIQQIKFEGFSRADAEYAVGAITVDWNKQAAETANDYLSTSSFSRSGLIEQLKFEGFTAAQAEYGVQKAY
jgi:hypothetical protein